MVFGVGVFAIGAWQVVLRGSCLARGSPPKYTVVGTNGTFIKHGQVREGHISCICVVDSSIPNRKTDSNDFEFSIRCQDVQEDHLKLGLTPANIAESRMFGGVWGVEPESSWGNLDYSVGPVRVIGKVQSRVRSRDTTTHAHARTQ